MTPDLRPRRFIILASQVRLVWKRILVNICRICSKSSNSPSASKLDCKRSSYQASIKTESIISYKRCFGILNMLSLLCSMLPTTLLRRSFGTFTGLFPFEVCFKFYSERICPSAPLLHWGTRRRPWFVKCVSIVWGLGSDLLFSSFLGDQLFRIM